MSDDRREMAPEDSFEVGEAWEAERVRKSELVAAVRAIENKSTGGLTKFFVLLVSLAVFVAAGVAWWDPWMVAMLVVVLLFHEAGHYVAMRLFGYRNVKMFFIPFLGAAVSGRHFNISGWKKALVYLAGPLPGILVSLPIMAIGIATDRHWLLEFGGMALLLNTLNLLPIMPLDGGWIMHLTVFSRSPLLELGARLIGIAAMFAFAYFTGSSFILLIAIPLVLSLPTSYRIAKLIRRLRGRTLPQPQRDEIPDAAIGFLDDEIQTSPLAATPTASKAAMIVQMYESLIVRPPGVISTLAIWAIYGGAFVIAIGGGLGVLLSRDLIRGGAFDRGPFDSQQHVVPLDENQVEFHLGSAPIDASYLAIARFPSSAELEAAIRRLDQDALNRYSHARFGDVWLASIPQAAFLAEPHHDPPLEKDFANEFIIPPRPIDPAETWIAKIIALSTHDASGTGNGPVVQVVSGLHRSSLELRATAATPDVAQRIVHESFEMPGIGGSRLLIPPWSPLDPPTPKQRQCRDVLKRLMDGVSPETSAELWREKQAIEKAQLMRHLEGDIDPAVAAERAARLRDIQKQHTALVMRTLDGEQAAVAEMYQRYQNAALEYQANAERKAGEEARNVDAPYPRLEDFLADEDNLLGFADATKRSQHYAAHVTGSVLTTNDLIAQREDNPEFALSADTNEVGGRVINLSLHRATDQVATISALIAYLNQFGFDSFELRYVTSRGAAD